MLSITSLRYVGNLKPDSRTTQPSCLDTFPVGRACQIVSFAVRRAVISLHAENDKLNCVPRQALTTTSLLSTRKPNLPSDMLMHATTLPSTALPSRGPLQRNSYKPFATSQAAKSQLSRKHRCRCSSSKTEAAHSAMQPSKNPSTAAVSGRITSQGYMPGPAEDPPSYADIDSSPWNRAIMAIFRQKMVTALHEDSEAKG